METIKVSKSMEKKEYLLFDAARKNDYDGNDVTNVSLGEHLDYVYGYGGTPDFFDSVEVASFTQMKSEVARLRKNTGMEFYVVDPQKERVVYVAKSKEKNNDLTP